MVHKVTNSFLKTSLADLMMQILKLSSASWGTASQQSIPPGSMYPVPFGQTTIFLQRYKFQNLSKITHFQNVCKVDFLHPKLLGKIYIISSTGKLEFCRFGDACDKTT